MYKDENRALAALLFDGEALRTIDDYEELYKPRETHDGQMITRLGPSPTGFIHLGNLYMAYINKKFAKQSGGACYLRVEDTDEKRAVEGAVDTLIDGLAYFGIDFDEGAGQGNIGNISDTDSGEYGPYYQSDRRDIYRTFAKELVLRGHAYPCFLTEEEIDQIRAGQEEQKRTPGIYKGYSKYRDASLDDVKTLIAEGKPYVLRLRAEGTEGEFRSGFDAVRGELKLPVNFMDIVVLKKTGMPTYHFAHIVDDHLMHTTHVIRGEEWLSSLPIHLNLFELLEIDPPVYAHATVLMKFDDETGKKRKLSKRKDPELSLTYYMQEGYHKAAIEEYLLTIINSDYEEWRAEHLDASTDEFKISFEKMSNSGILFDLDKLRDVSKDALLRLPAEEIADYLIDWAYRYAASEPELSGIYEVLSSDKPQLAQILDIGRSGAKPRKDLSYAKQIWEHISYFYDDFYKITDDIPEHIADGDAAVLLKEYIENHDINDDRDTWFAKIRELGTKHGYAAKPKDFKKNPDDYKGHVGDVSALIRLALVGKTTSPDIYEIEQIMGAEKVNQRILGFLG
ncbi:MAG: glutamate--tRNA ligase [Clostridiales Family XIII bacterium]|jgi:glutamyl-tRNA synthetase|nr:glutamate--tRNA ligase [Clostridiales Family XIII bacterium]